MFFLKALPSQQMISSYTDIKEHVEVISNALSMMRQASLLIRKIEQYFTRNELSQLKFLVLIVIDREPDRTSLRHSEIADRLDVSKPVLHRTIKSLILSGLLQTSVDDNDQRAQCLSISQTGKAKLSQVLPGYFDMIRTFMSEHQPSTLHILPKS